MMNHDIDETGLEYEENQNALEQEAWESMSIERFENEGQDEGHMYPDDVEQDEYPW